MLPKHLKKFCSKAIIQILLVITKLNIYTKQLVTKNGTKFFAYHLKTHDNKFVKKAALFNSCSAKRCSITENNSVSFHQLNILNS